MSGIGLPEKRHYQIDIPEEDWPVPTVLPIPEQEPAYVPVPGELPDWLDPISEPEPVKPEREPEKVPA